MSPEKTGPGLRVLEQSVSRATTSEWERLMTRVVEVRQEVRDHAVAAGSRRRLPVCRALRQ